MMPAAISVWHHSRLGSGNIRLEDEIGKTLPSGTDLLRRRMPVDAERLRDGIGCFALSGSLGDLYRSSASSLVRPILAPLAFAGYSRLRPLADLLCLYLRQGREQRQQDVMDLLCPSWACI